MLANKSLTDVLDAFSSSDPTPGGGSAAALCGALGASLLAMVAGLPKTKSNTPEERVSLDAARGKILALRGRLVDLIDRDAASYDAVVAAYRLPKASDADKTARTAAIQAALKRATEVPLETILVCADVVDEAVAVAEASNPSARSDIGVGTQMLMTAIQGALLNVEANIGSVTDQTFVADVSSRIRNSAAIRSDAMLKVYKSAGIFEMFRQTTKRLGIEHGHPPGGKDSKGMWMRTAIEMLRSIASPDARGALEALAGSADDATARMAKDALSGPGPTSFPT
jgi:formiminotetrahydrofolate cyclodeaminase